MGRYSKDIQLEQPIDVVSMVMEDFVYHNRFSRTDWNPITAVVMEGIGTDMAACQRSRRRFLKRLNKAVYW